MSEDPVHVTDAEFAVLEQLWQSGPCGIRQIADRLYPTKGTSGYTTVQKLLERLEAKGCVSRDRSSFAHVFCASLSRDELIGRQLQAVANRMCNGLSTPLLINLVQSGRLSLQERQTLRRLLDDGQ